MVEKRSILDIKLWIEKLNVAMSFLSVFFATIFSPRAADDFIDSHRKKGPSNSGKRLLYRGIPMYRTSGPTSL
jgi:hypothetical protein